MAYEVWSTVAGSILGGYDTEDAALAAVRTAVERYGPAYGDGLALAYEDRSGRSRPIAQGAELVRRAMGVQEPRAIRARVRNPVPGSPRTAGDSRAVSSATGGRGTSAGFAVGIAAKKRSPQTR
jgi:hypothetical protein